MGVPWRGNYGRPVQGDPPEGETFGPCAAAALYRTDAFRRAGGFDERFFCYYEDVDLAFHLRLMGERCIQVADAVVRHVGSSPSEGNKAFIVYHLSRNQHWTFVKNMPGPLFWLLLPGHLALHAYFLFGARRSGSAGPMWRGIKDGVAGLGPILRSRRSIQSARTTSWLDIGKALTWSPAKFFRGHADVRPAG